MEKVKNPCVRPFTHVNGPLSGTNQVSRYQKGKTTLDFIEARDSEWQWHQLGRMQVCTLLQTDNHASTHRSVFYRPDALPAAQPTASNTEGTCVRPFVTHIWLQIMCIGVLFLCLDIFVAKFETCWEIQTAFS